MEGGGVGVARGQGEARAWPTPSTIDLYLATHPPSKTEGHPPL
jgi:hypothetical protein